MTDHGIDHALVSVIVPAHNAARYLRDCLNSILQQSLQSLEIVVVDDGSTDNTPELLAKAHQSDARIRVITLPTKMGVSNARNVGLDSATGEFVAFVDADDLIEASMYETLTTTARELDCDVASCAITSTDAAGVTLNETPFPLPTNVRFGRDEVKVRLQTAFRDRLVWFPCRSVYRRAILDRYGLRFPVGLAKGEDSVFNLRVLSAADGVACVPHALYRYRQHCASATARPLDDESANLKLLTSQVMDCYHDAGLGAQAEGDFYSQFLRSDVPTALIRLGSHPQPRTQVSLITHLDVVARAFEVVALRRLRVPVPVRLLLLAVRLRADSVITLAVRAWAPRGTRKR